MTTPRSASAGSMRHRWGRPLVALLALALLTVAALLIRFWPRAPLAASIPSSTAFFDSHGQLLRLTLASDQQYRLWTPIDRISPTLVDALLLHEDRHFYRHAGVNPAAIVRAAYATGTGSSHQGGSTLTMQLARLMYGLNTRTVSGKCRQIALAIGLELRYSKRELLEAHLNLMPFGSNIQGVGTASLVYFGKTANQLSLNEALSLVVIPQSPLKRTPERIEPENLRAARLRLLDRWTETHPISPADRQLAAASLRYASNKDLPFAAPHLTAMLLRQRSASREQRLTIDLPTQRLSERVIASYVREQSRIGIRNASMLLVDYRDMSVRALVGSADFSSSEILGQVNGTQAKRSPGSALKPFIYGLSIDQGLIHPLTVLKDAPTSFGSFSPENFDGRFTGPITATEALTRSRNVPAVALASRLTQPSLYQFLQSAGVADLASENHYGLSLALGGGEVTMEELTTLYAMLANRGTLAPLRYRSVDPQVNGPRVLSDEASFMVLEMLKTAPRPDGNQWDPSARLPIAWKTGTSWGFRDAWTVGIVGPYVLAVWVGNFDGHGDPALVGVQAAAPLFFRMVDALLAHHHDLREPIVQMPARLAQVEVCSASGDLPNAECPQTSETWYIPGVSPIRVSQIHRRVWIDERTGKQACPPYDTHVHSEVFEFWPSDLQHLFAQAGMPRRAPPPAVDCEHSVSNDSPPQITSPVRTVAYQLRLEHSSSNFVPLAANTASEVRRVHWFADDTYLGTGPPTDAIAWRPEHAGRYMIRAVDDQGRADGREVVVEEK